MLAGQAYITSLHRNTVVELVLHRHVPLFGVAGKLLIPIQRRSVASQQRLLKAGVPSRKIVDSIREGVAEWGRVGVGAVADEGLIAVGAALNVVVQEVQARSGRSFGEVHRRGHVIDAAAGTQNRVIGQPIGEAHAGSEQMILLWPRPTLRLQRTVHQYVGAHIRLPRFRIQLPSQNRVHNIRVEAGYTVKALGIDTGNLPA